MTDNWCEIVETLQSAREKRSITEQEYQHEIEACLKMLGWKTSNGTMRSQFTINIGSSNSIRPDVVLFKDGQPVLPIEIKKPTNLCNQRQSEQLISYMRQLRLNVGLFIGENIQLYYDNPQDKEVSASIFCAEISKNDSNGDTICDLLSYENFTIENIEKFCQEQYQYRIKHKDLQRCIRELCSNGEVIKNLIKEKFLQEGFDEKALDEELSKISVEVRRRDMVTPFTPEYRETPKRKWEGRNKESGYYGKMGRTVLTTIKKYVLEHPDIRFPELKNRFPDYLIGTPKSLGVVRTLDSIEEQIRGGRRDLRDRNRYFLKEEDIIVLKDGTKVVVCSQWVTPAFLEFCSHVEKNGLRV
ncbi:MAG: type I restriction enzyme HsdR N-terminal domain-containing protein [Bacteroidales bacterium]|nr:type I restriction enzyme HsdR N-terminal domain-containing protein [Bacteroidales bacterium]